MRSPVNIYKRRERAYEFLLQKQMKASGLLGNLRLVVVIAGIAASIVLYKMGFYVFLAGVASASLVTYIYLVIKHDKLIRRKAKAETMSAINKDSAKRCTGKWNSFTDRGDDFIDLNHYYSSDLDIFGENSLFQLINTAKTYTGRNILKKFLTSEPIAAVDIKKRQEAVSELSFKLCWRQRFQTEALLSDKAPQDPSELYSWVNTANAFFRKTGIIALIRLLPALSISLLLVAWSGIITVYIPYFLFAVQFALLGIRRREREEVFRLARKYKKDIGVYYNMIRQLETEKFNSAYINEIKLSMQNKDGYSACSQLDKLFKIADTLDNRSNSFYMVMNILLLWDYQNIIALEKWKENSGRHLKSWLEAVGYAEALASLSVIGFDNRKWAIPEFVPHSDANGCVFDADSMGHPLLNENRVNNNLQVKKPVKSLLITGSNMSGKSTLLRAAGINLVLAYAGASVCAKSFHVSIMQIHTCMRIGDNLAKNISSFYAELLRIKTIVQEADKGKSCFYLLDEVFKGTNSTDRHMGAKVLIERLCGTNSIGLVSTHDLELCDLENINSAVRNYHFREYYNKDSIYFDYKLNPGPSTTRNAAYLMKLAGIDLDGVNK